MPATVRWRLQAWLLVASMQESESSRLTLEAHFLFFYCTQRREREASGTGPEPTRAVSGVGGDRDYQGGGCACACSLRAVQKVNEDMVISVRVFGRSGALFFLASLLWPLWWCVACLAQLFVRRVNNVPCAMNGERDRGTAPAAAGRCHMCYIYVYVCNIHRCCAICVTRLPVRGSAPTRAQEHPSPGRSRPARLLLPRRLPPRALYR